MSGDHQSEARNSVGKGGFVKPWLWLWFGSFAVMFAAALLVEISAGESIQRINFQTKLLQAALTGSALTGLVFVFWVFRYHDESGGKPVLLLILGAVLGLILFTSLFYAVENYRGKRAWIKCFHTSVARGEKLTLAELAPPIVPDDENCAMQPIWVEAITAHMGLENARSWYGDRVRAFDETNSARPLDLRVELFDVLPMTNNAGSWQLAQATDLTLWQDYYRQLAQRTNYFPIPAEPQSPAEDVLMALDRHNDIIEQMRAASALPYARFPLDYANGNPAVILLPHLTKLKYSVTYLQLRASAELRSRKSDLALQDIKLMLRLNDLIRDEPILISHLVQIAMFQIEVQVIWEGLAEQRWNDTQLARLDAWLAQADFLRSYTSAMAGEKAFGCQVINYSEQNRRKALDVVGLPFRLPGNLGENKTLANCVAVAIPRGWFDQNKAAVWRFYDEHLDRLIETTNRTYSISNSIRLDNDASRLATSPSPYNGFANMLLPALSKAAKKFAFAQQSLDFTRLAIALERYRLANGYFPETLDALSPTFLAQVPRDVISGKPLKYRRTENGSFILYSVGWNQTDDGGTVSQTPTGRPNPELGDWVWRYPDPKK